MPGLADLVPPPESTAARWRIRTGAVVVVLLAALALTVVISAVGSSGASTEVPPAPVLASGPALSVEAEIIVQVAGAVRMPGIYSLPTGARLLDAVAAAGGLTDDADASAVNLARAVNDGEQLVVPRVGEAPPEAAPGAGASGSSSQLVDLNTATLEQLDTLPRIGPSIAQRIIDWRAENGRFTSVDDLAEISGIGDKTIESLRGLVLP